MTKTMTKTVFLVAVLMSLFSVMVFADADISGAGGAVIGVQPLQVDFRIIARQAVVGKLHGVPDFHLGEQLPAIGEVFTDEQAEVAYPESPVLPFQVGIMDVEIAADIETLLGKIQALPEVIRETAPRLALVAQSG